MKKAYKALEKISSILFTGQKIVLILMVIGIVGVTIADIFLRIVISRGIAWAQELCIALFMSLIFLGANIAIKTDGEIKIDLLHFKNNHIQTAVLTVADVVCLAIIAYLVYSSVASVQNVLVHPQKLATLPLDYAILYMVMPVGFVLMFIDKTVAVLRRIYDKDLSLRLHEEAVKMENSDE